MAGRAERWQLSKAGKRCCRAMAAKLGGISGVEMVGRRHGNVRAQVTGKSASCEGAKLQSVARRDTSSLIPFPQPTHTFLGTIILIENTDWY